MSCETDTGPIRYVDGEIAAGTTAALSIDLTDESGAALTLIDLASLTLTLVDQSTGFVINSRDAADVKNANDGVVEEVTVDGVPRLRLRMLLTVDDTEIQVAGRTQESHAALFIWTYATTHVGKVLVIFSVVSTEESAGVGPGSLPSGAPATVEYLVGALSGSLSAERLVTDTATITWDLSTPGQAKANASVVGGVSSFNARSGAVVPVAGDYAESDITGLVADLAAKATVASVTAEAITRAADDLTLQGNINGKQPLHANLTALAGLVGASDRAFYFTAPGALSLYTLTTFGRTLAALADASALRTAGGLVIGTDVQAFHANLTAFAGLSLVADRLPYANGAGTLALATFTSFGRTVAALADYAALRTGAGLVIGTDVAAQGDARFPSAGEKSALVGTSGTPGSGNKYVTDADSRNSDTRTPTDNTVSAAKIQTDAVITAKVQANAITNAKLAQMAALTFKGNNTGGASDPLDLTVAQVRAALFVGVHVFHSTTQSTTSGTALACAANSERYDYSDPMHDTVTNNSRITFKVAGKYLVGCFGNWQANATGNRRLEVRLNGATLLVGSDAPSGVAGGVVSLNNPPAIIAYDFAVNDYVEAMATQGSGSTLTFTLQGFYAHMI